MFGHPMRQSKLELVKMRLEQGFYFTPEVLEIIAEKIMAEWERDKTKS
jgi:hypothetical protein